MIPFRRTLSFVFASLLFVSATGMAQLAKAEMPDDVSLELLGRDLVYSFSYQHLFSPKFGLEAGVSLLGGSGSSVFFLNGGGRFYFSSRNSSPCISAGVVFASASYGGPLDSDAATSYGYVGPGFEYRSSSGFLFRGTVYFIFRTGFFVWPGIQAGIAF